MNALDSLHSNLSNPVILCFLLGVFARTVKSDLRLPEQFYQSISLYLLLAIGLKGGVQLSYYTFEELTSPFLAAVLISIVTTACSFVVAKYFGKRNFADSSALAAHFGSVSAITYVTCLGFLDESKISYPGYMTAIFAFMEIPAILMSTGIYSYSKGIKMKQVLNEIFTGKTSLLLIGGMFIGWVAGEENTSSVMPLFQDIFYGMLTFFLLEMGLLVGDRLKDIPKGGVFILLFSVFVPLFHGLIGVLIATLFNFDLGTATIFGTLAASASYIAAPAAVRTNIPSADPGLYLTASLAITFPFNIIFGIPIYFWFSERLSQLM